MDTRILIEILLTLLAIGGACASTVKYLLGRITDLRRDHARELKEVSDKHVHIMERLARGEERDKTHNESIDKIEKKLDALEAGSSKIQADLSSVLALLNGSTKK